MNEGFSFLTTSPAFAGRRSVGLSHSAEGEMQTFLWELPSENSLISDNALDLVLSLPGAVTESRSLKSQK